MINPIDPSLAQNSAEEQNLKEIKRKADKEIQNLDPNAATAKEKKLREAAEGFEAIFIQQMWQSMRASLPKEGIMHSREEQFWQGMYDQELGKSMASAGGIGLADMMMAQLSKKLENASEVTAESMHRTPLDIKPVPLIEEKAPQELKPTNKKLEHIYNGELSQHNSSIKNNTKPSTTTNTLTPVEEALNEFSKQIKTPSSTPTENITSSDSNTKPPIISNTVTIPKN